MPSTWLVFDRIRAYTRAGRVYQHERVFQDQSQLDRITAGAEFLDWNQQASILDQTNLQINRLQRYKDYEQMDQTGVVSLALDLYADESSLLDPERKHTLIIRARNRRLKKELEELFFQTLQWDSQCRPTIRYLCKFGDCPYEVVPTRNRDGVAALKHMNVYNFTRVETRYGDLVGFFFQDDLIPEPAFLHPWQVMHLRLTSLENIYHPYGRCLDSSSLVNTPSGLVAIKDIKKGDTVYAWDGDKAVERKVIGWVASGKKRIWQIKTKHHTIKCSGNHPILIDGKGYIRADQLKYGYRVIVPCIGQSDLAYVTDDILSIDDTGEDAETCDIQVDDLHNFVAEGIVVHNSILDGGRKAFKQLRLMEDAALIYRITRAPEKRKFKIPVGLIPAKEVPEYMEIIARKFKRQRFYNPATGTFDERYSPLIQEDDFFLPQRPDGTGPDVETLPGAENLDAIADIEYFKKNMVAPMKIPFARVGIGEGAGEASEKSLSAVHPEFAKAVQWVQRETAAGLTKVAIIHLALRGYSIEDLKGFELTLPSTSAIEELYRIETWQTRVQVMTDLKGLAWFPKEWIVTHFTDLTTDEIQELKEMEEAAAEAGDEEGVGGDEAGGGMGGGLGGMDDFGGGEAGGLDDGGLGGEAGDGGAPGGAPDGAPGDAGGAGGDEGGLGEAYDSAAVKRVLTELRRRGKHRKIMELVRKWARRRGHDEAPGATIANHFQYLLESKELDGLSKGDPTDQAAQTTMTGQHTTRVLAEEVPTADRSEPRTKQRFTTSSYTEDDPGLLVSWSVPPAERQIAITETLAVLVDMDDGAVDDAEITEADLPQ